jgi:hypothetical protein
MRHLLPISKVFSATFVPFQQFTKQFLLPISKVVHCETFDPYFRGFQWNLGSLFHNWTGKRLLPNKPEVHLSFLRGLTERI